MEWREKDGVRWLEAELGAARAAFSTRLGGVSEAPFDSLNLGLHTDDEVGAIAKNHGRLAAALGVAPERLIFAYQVHGTRLLTHTADAKGLGRFKHADGHVVTDPGPVPLVFAADCLPVALAGPGGAAMLHCGWRGLAAGIVAAGAETVGATSAAIGPGIGPCCYEVGPEVLDAFSDLTQAAGGPISADMGGKSAHPRLDLPEVARRLLRTAGVEQIESADLCTSCEQELFFSHRRDAGSTGRQAGLVWIEPQDA